MGDNFSRLLECRRKVVKLQQEAAEREALIAKLKEEIYQPPLPEIELLSLTGQAAEAEIQRLGLRLMYPSLMDWASGYFYTNDEGWAEVFDYIYLVFNMPPYIAGRMDCEDFGLLLKGLVSALFGLNYFGFTVGQVPEGTHGFNFFRTSDRWLIIEPQNAQFFEWGERGYKPVWALI